MTLTKAHIADSISDQCDFSKAKSIQLVEAVLEFIKVGLESGENVLLSGFGKFCVKGEKARGGRDPATGNDMRLGAGRAVTFRCSPVLKAKLNGKE